MSGARRRRLLSVFPGFGIGGAQVRFAALANWLGDDYEHVIVSLNGDISACEKLDPGLHVSFPASGHVAGRMGRAVMNARTFIRAQVPDVVMTSNWGAIEWAIGARLVGVRHVHTEDGFGPEERTHQIKRRVLTRRAALRGSDVVLPSQNLLRIASDIWKLPRQRLHYIPNGIDLARFSGAQPAPLPAGEGLAIGTIAALRPEKNIGRLLRAFAGIAAARQLRLVIVGDGSERAGLEALAATLGIAAKVHFVGHSPQAETWLARFHIFALSSDTEQMPLSLLEAMAAGLPCVCTRVGDVADMVAAENLAFVTAVSDDAFAAGLAAMLDADRPVIGAANMAKARAAYAQDEMFKTYAALLDRTRPP